MCTNPVQRTISYKGNFSKKTVIVPCGKCAECRAKAQSEFAALSVLEAESAGSIGFITLTYSDESLPLLITTRREFKNEGVTIDECLNSRFSSGYAYRFSPCAPLLVSSPDPDGNSLWSCPSLRREDVQKLIKRYRQDYFRRRGERCDFRFTFFGEYGERFKRPHYHMLVYGLDKVECQRLCDLWRFGFSDLKYVTHFNCDGSDAFAKVSRYVSKYVGKRDYLPDFVRAGFAEKPRKQSSIRLGVRDLNLEALRFFTLLRIPELLRFQLIDYLKLLNEKSVS